jgi:hypothetical protein
MPPPLFPEGAAQPTLYPGIQFLQARLSFCKAHVPIPPFEIGSEVLYHTTERNTTGPPCPPTDLVLACLQGLVTHPPPVWPTSREAQPEERPPPWGVDGTLGLIDGQPEPSRQEPRHAGPYALTGSYALNVDITIIRVPHEPVSSAFSLFV